MQRAAQYGKRKVNLPTQAAKPSVCGGAGDLDSTRPASAGTLRASLQQPGGTGMPDPLSTLVIVALAVAGLSLVLARLIPDEYDRLKPETIRERRPSLG
jgi:hypothetical protein